MSKPLTGAHKRVANQKTKPTVNDWLKGLIVHGAVWELDSSGYQRLIIDLRHPSGDPKQAVSLLCYENSQAGETALKINGVRETPDEGKFS